MADVKTAYPARYYASYDATAAQPTPVTGWYDVWGMSSISNVPEASAMIALTEAQWDARLPTGQGVQAGAIVSYTPPAVAVPLKTQAASAQAWIMQQASLAAAMGEVFTTDMKTYVTKITAIANGTDTTSTALPAQPTDVMTASTATTTTTT
ncbi:hypothetical protein [Komagataeibacter xylinus]|uniref:hypothetical protein n=1 Tax=Komagataeibacter xylinus TaxID=28448 RepID=UPI00280B8D37|nr:hypothetical protein [Komagataeibacter xylinus]